MGGAESELREAVAVTVPALRSDESLPDAWTSRASCAGKRWQVDGQQRIDIRIWRSKPSRRWHGGKGRR